MQVAPAPLLRSLQFSARVATAARVELGSTLTGRVVEVQVQEGQAVRRGELLLSLETDELQATLAQAQVRSPVWRACAAAAAARRKPAWRRLNRCCLQPRPSCSAAAS